MAQKNAGGPTQPDKNAQSSNRKKRAGRETRTIKYVKLDKERPSLTRDAVKDEQGVPGHGVRDEEEVHVRRGE